MLLLPNGMSEMVIRSYNNCNMAGLRAPYIKMRNFNHHQPVSILTQVALLQENLTFWENLPKSDFFNLCSFEHRLALL